jgi:hypothetical protein
VRELLGIAVIFCAIVTSLANVVAHGGSGAASRSVNHPFFNLAQAVRVARCW